MIDTDVQNTFCNYLNCMKKFANSPYPNFNYYTTDDFEKFYDGITDNVELSIFHLHIHSFNRNSEELFQFIQSIKFDFNIIVLSEIIGILAKEIDKPGVMYLE